MADVGFNNRVGREEKWINTGAQERDLLLEECLPACLSHHLVRNEERDKSLEGPSWCPTHPSSAGLSLGGVAQCILPSDSVLASGPSSPGAQHSACY